MTVLPELAASMAGRPCIIEVHYHGGVGYWAKVNGKDAGSYSHTWDGLCDDLRKLVPALAADTTALQRNEKS